LGWGAHLLALSIPFGLISILLSYWQCKEATRHDAMDIALTPFSSLSQVLAARRRVPLFAKKRCPGHLMKRMVGHAIIVNLVNLASWLYAGVMWLIFSPIPLAFLAMPETDRKLKVRVSAQLKEQKS
jgi:hypothetical protein